MLAAAAIPAQDAPRFANLTTSRVLVLPAQEVIGAQDKTAWLARFDSLFTARLADGGIGAGWAYAGDAVHYMRQNPAYLSDPHMMGTQALKAEKIKPGTPLTEPFASRLRAYVAIANSRNAIVPVAARLDSTVTPHVAKLQVAIVDARLSQVVLTLAVDAKYEGAPIAAAESLAAAMARLFVSNQ